MRFVALVSGGKDSLYSIAEASRQGHELACGAHLSPRGGVLESDSFMYQSAASNALPALIEECLGVPLVSRECRGRAVRTDLGYENDEDEDEDEVEDLLYLLRDVVDRFPSVTAVCCGAILSDYQRTRVEHVCDRLSLTPLCYLWRVGSQRSLLRCMVEDGVEAVLVKTAAPGLSPHRHLNRTIGELHHGGVFERLWRRFRFHHCGEGGEYETLVLDCPLFPTKRLVLEEVEVVCPDGEPDDRDHNLEGKVGLLRVVKCRAVDKTEEEVRRTEESARTLRSRPPLPDRLRAMDEREDDDDDDEVKDVAEEPVAPTSLPSSSSSPSVRGRRRVALLPHAKSLPCGFVHFSGLSSTKSVDCSSSSSSDAAVEQFLDVLASLRRGLAHHGLDARDVAVVHLYLADMSDFARLNAHYRDFFGTVAPPARVCVGAPLGGGRRVLLDAAASRRDDGDGGRRVLHVQSRSHWAPTCVGPYAQARVAPRSGLVWLAGMVGLAPATMAHVDADRTAQLRRCWTHAAAVLDALGGALSDALGAVVLLDAAAAETEDDVVRECRRAIATRLTATNDDDDDDDHDGYEDEETRRAVEGDGGSTVAARPNNVASSIPLIVVRVPRLPVDSLAEVELVCATHRAAACVGATTIDLVDDDDDDDEEEPDRAGPRWDCGRDRPSRRRRTTRAAGRVRCLRACCAVAWIVVDVLDDDVDVDPDDVLAAVARLVGRAARAAGLTDDHVAHARAYHRLGNDDDDGLATAAAAALGGGRRRNRPAITIVPTSGLGRDETVLAAQVTILDPVHADTETWIRHGR